MTRKQEPAADNIWLALHTLKGAEVPRAHGYQRVSIGWAMKNARGRFINHKEVSFPTATGTWADGKMVRWAALYWDEVGGKPCYWFRATPPSAVYGCCTVFFPPGQLPMLKSLMSRETLKRLREVCG